MSGSLAKEKSLLPGTTAPVRTETGPGEVPLYFKNSGLFSDTYLLHHLPDTNNNAFVLTNWETEAEPSFSEAYEWMLSTWDELKEILPTLNEAQLEERWVRPILKKLGWEIEVQDRLKKRGKTQIPDYSLFESLEAYKKAKACKSDDAYFRNVLAIADAKAMGVPLDGTARSNSNPSYQIIRYLEDTGKTWGILTDGMYWRLYSTRSQSKYADYYEINLEKILAKRDDSRFKYFFNLFRKEAFRPDVTSGQCFLDVVFEGGEQYAKEVESRLKGRAFRMVEMLCRGFSGEKQGLSEAELKVIYDHSLYYLFRMMFVLNCEARGLLDVSKQSDYFVYSLRSLCVKLKEEFEQSRTWSDQPRSYNYISDLFDLLRSGDKRIGLHGFGDEVFASGSTEFYEKRKIPDSILNYVLVELALSYDDNGSLKFIDYKRLSPDHLGSLFEGLLEFHPLYAKKKLVRVNEEIKEWDDLPPKKQEQFKEVAIEKGMLFLESSSSERKNTGSYYTPLSVVNYIAKSTLEPLINELSAEEILDLRCVDPAMGSGPFLLGVISALEEKVLEKLYTEDDGTSDIDPQEIRWRILHSCIYGIDLNPLAVELCKFSLWMFTARRGHCVEPLDDQLACGNSLKDETWNSAFSNVISEHGGFDAIVGNPPYVRIQGLTEKDADEIKRSFRTAGHGNFDIYVAFVEKGLSKISKNGRLGFILPHKFMNADYGMPLRAFISEGKHLDRLVHFGDVQVFPSATTYTCLLFLTGQANESFEFSKVKALSELADDSLEFRTFKSSMVSDSPWQFGDQESAIVLAKIKKQECTLEDYSKKIFVGLQTSGDGIYVLRVVKETKSEYVLFSKELGEEVTLEKKLCHPLLRGAEITRFGSPVVASVVIFPYSVDGEKVAPISLSELKSKFPKTHAYLSKNKPRLLQRSSVTEDNWWLYPYPKSLAYYGKSKIISQVLSQSGKFFYDREGIFYFLGGGTAGGNAIILNSDDSDLYKLILGVLNSTVTNLYVTSVGSAFRGGFFAFGKSSLSALPIPKLDLSSKECRVVISLVDKRDAARDEATKIELEAQIDRAVGKLYGLKESEIEVLLALRARIPERKSEAA